MGVLTELNGVLVSLNDHYRDCCIYGIWDVDQPKKIYIGKTIQFQKRARRHLRDLKASEHGNSYLQRLYNKGKVLLISPFEYCTEEELLNKEVLWIDLLDTSAKGYNLTKGGHDIPRELLLWSPERRSKQSEYCSLNPIARGYPKSEAWKQKYREGVHRKRELGILINRHLNKKCTVIEVKSGRETTYINLKEASRNEGLAYTYLTEKIKRGDGSALIRNLKIMLS